MSESEIARQLKEAVDNVDTAVAAAITAVAALKKLAEKLPRKDDGKKE
jgi:pilus assembly protein TadC